MFIITGGYSSSKNCINIPIGFEEINSIPNEFLMDFLWILMVPPNLFLGS